MEDNKQPSVEVKSVEVEKEERIEKFSLLPTSIKVEEEREKVAKILSYGILGVFLLIIFFPLIYFLMDDQMPDALVKYI
ncbi:MAG: hypothetical protein AAB267_04870 [Candidatus Desantisbacteria bacterium]